MTSVIGDVTDQRLVEQVVRDVKPEIVIHMAAQPLVRQSYSDPVETYATNVMGTVNLATMRSQSSAKVFLNVTTDKCYENREWNWGYRD